jgi:hypothetical protein
LSSHPTVLLFTGHLIDQAGRRGIRFPLPLLDKARAVLKAEIAQVVQMHRPRIAVSSLAAGGDLLFAQEVLDLKIPLVVFLPFEVQKFLELSVAYEKSTPEADPQQWAYQFHHIIHQVQETLITGSDDLALEVALKLCNDRMLAYALACADNDPQKVLAFALVKSINEINKGGSSEFIRSIKSYNIPVKLVWPPVEGN